MQLPVVAGRCSPLAAVNVGVPTLMQSSQSSAVAMSMTPAGLRQPRL
ncbi:hypothetical protein I553_10408 [Mycobacterium xenopi 4042]|uniref:Uncharacterized protein n=1 Tax=Mycobacterium xenopi 4042 TaxID=1299334 RepID=X7ZIT8_MYCXE|nr:hypothetical protein I553_10408 [Mycobacterium xenopi 4042]